MLLLVENCLVRTYHVEEKPAKCFSRRKGSHNIFGPNTSEYSLTRKNLHGKRGGRLSFFYGQETKEHLERLTTERGLQVCCQYVFCFRYNAYILRFNSQ